MRKDPKEYASELVEWFKGIVYPYIGSSMLTNDPSEEVILRNAKLCATKVVEELITAIPWEHGKQSSEDWQYYNEVKQAIIEMP